MTRCKHRNGIIREYVNHAHYFYDLRDGELTKLNFDEGDYASIEIECKDCGKTFKFSSLSKSPQWVQKLFNQMIEV